MPSVLERVGRIFRLAAAPRWAGPTIVALGLAAAVLEGIEGTLEELIGRVDPSDVRDRLTALQDETAAVRRSLEETVSARLR